LKKTEQALSEVSQHIRNCVDAIAAGGADALSDELKERTAALRDRKQELIVQREQKRQDLRACDEEQIEEKSIIEAIGKLGETLVELSPDEQKELLGLIVNRIEVHPAPGEKTNNRRPVILRYEIGLPKLVASMQERVVVRGVAGDVPQPVRQAIVLTSTVALGTQTVDGSSAILSPFEHWVRNKTATKPQSDSVRHVIHRALAWREELRRDPTMQKQFIAEREKLSPSAITHHFKLLALTPAVQQFLQDLTDPAAVHYFSLRKMRRLADLPEREQKRVFAELRENFSSGLSVG